MLKNGFLLKLLFYLLIPLLAYIFTNQAKGVEDSLLLKAKIQPLKENKKAPDFSLEDLKGRKISFNHFKGKVVFLNFWATWCGPCKEEMPSIEDLYQKFKEKHFVFLTISVDYGDKKLVKEFIEKHKYSFPTLIDPKYIVIDLYGVNGIPTTFIIDKKGKLIGKVIGPRNWTSEEIVSILNYMIED